MAGVSDAEVDGRLKDIASAAASSRGVELVDLICVRSGRRQIVRLIVDRLGGVTVDECADVSRRVAADLDDAGILEGRYLLEVSSPGLDRPLKTAADFRRKEGKQVCLHYAGDNDEACTIEGVIGPVDDTAVTVGGQRVTLDRIKEGKLVV